MLNISNLKTEYLSRPVGIDTACPRFSWILESDKNNTVQTAWKIIVKDSKKPVWDSGKMRNSKSVQVEYSGQALKARTEYQVTVKVWDNHGQSAEATAFFETGLKKKFKGGWITHGYEDKVEPCPVFIKEFPLKGKIKSARLYASALGIYEISLNGQKAGDGFFAPGWTSYHNRIQYQTYNITDLLREKNRIEITAANGWLFGMSGNTVKYGTRIAVWAQMEITFEDGSGAVITTDESWQYGTGKNRFAEIYHGQTIDNNFSVKAEGNTKKIDFNFKLLTAQECEPVRITQKIKPVKFICTPKGETVFDFGQNLTGVIEARLDCPKGTTVILRHAEVFDKEGNFYTENLRRARATDTFICRGDGEEIFLPGFTFHGFRYLKVEGLGDTPDPACFTACVMHTDMEQTGDFECSHSDVNRLQQNIRWSQRGNFLDIPTDCPQRDERLGWTGDAQIFASTAVYNYNSALFFTKWLRDLKAEQTLEFGVHGVVPNPGDKTVSSAAWSDAAAIVPWAVYEAYGDKRLLAEQYDSMKDWVEYIHSKAGDTNLWQFGHQYADWLALDGPGTDIYLVASAYYAYSAGIVAKAAKLLGHANDAKHYKKLQKDVVTAFQKEYISQTGRMVSETQTACVLALHFDLALPKLRSRILKLLVSNLAKRKDHLCTGFVGTPYLNHALSDNGCHELAGKVFLQEDFPSWLYPVKMGATTIWERWNSLQPDGSFSSAGMNSFNHYAYGSIGSWMYQKLGGLQIVKPGYKKSRIAPMPIQGIDSAKAVVKTVYGILSCEWKRENGKLSVDITVPCNTSAVVKLPGKKKEFIVGSGNYHYKNLKI